MRTLLNHGPADYTGEVLTLDDPAAPFLVGFGFPVHALGPLGSVYGFCYTDRLHPWLVATRDRFDGVIVNRLWQYTGLVAWRALHGRRPYLVFSHGMLDPYFKRAFPLKHLKKWLYWLTVEYWVLRSAYRVLFTTEAESRLAEQSFWLHRWHGAVVSFGANRPPAGEAELLDAFYTHHPEMRGRRFLLFLGRIHPKKGCDLLIHAFIRHAAEDPTLELVMAGPDQQGWSAELQSIVAHAGLEARVHWPGMLRGAVKWGAFYASEAFILPSHQENFGIAVAEALACGRPVLLADKVNIAPEIALDGAGLMELDTQAGTDALLRRWFATTPADRAKMARQAVLTFEARYDMQQSAANILRLFEGAR